MVWSVYSIVIIQARAKPRAGLETTRCGNVFDTHSHLCEHGDYGIDRIPCPDARVRPSDSSTHRILSRGVFRNSRRLGLRWRGDTTMLGPLYKYRQGRPRSQRLVRLRRRSAGWLPNSDTWLTKCPTSQRSRSIHRCSCRPDRLCIAEDVMGDACEGAGGSCGMVHGYCGRR